MLALPVWDNNFFFFNDLKLLNLYLAEILEITVKIDQFTEPNALRLALPLHTSYIIYLYYLLCNCAVVGRHCGIPKAMILGCHYKVKFPFHATSFFATLPSGTLICNSCSLSNSHSAGSRYLLRLRNVSMPHCFIFSFPALISLLSHCGPLLRCCHICRACWTWRATCHVNQ